MERNQGKPVDRWLPALTLTLVFVLVESLIAHRSPYWGGLEGREWFGIPVGFAVYFVGVFLSIEVLWRILRFVLPQRWPDGVCLLLAGPLSGLGLWELLSSLQKSVPPVCELAFFGAVAGLGTGLLLLYGKERASLRTFCMVTMLAVVAGLVSVPAVSRTFLLRPDRPELLTAGVFVWTVLSLSAVGTVWFFTKKRSFRLAVVTLVVLAPQAAPLVGLSALHPRERRSGPSVLFITSDALRADCCSVYGGTVATPALKRLAEGGVVFEHSFALAPWTVPSFVSLFASTYPPLPSGVSHEQRSVEVLRFWFLTARKTAAEAFDETGCVTGAFLGNTLIEHSQSILRGFRHLQAFDHLVRERGGVFRSYPLLEEGLGRVFPSVCPARPVDTSRLLGRYALAFFRRYRNTPFFLWIHYMDPHAPYDPPDRFRTERGPWRVFCPSDASWGSPVFDDQGSVGLTDREKAYVRSLYEGEAQYVDECVGALMAALDDLGLSDFTYVCFSADHGEEFWDHGRYGHGQSLYNELVRVPLIVGGPGIVSRRIEEPVSAIDLAPTFAELLGAEHLDTWRGTSLVPLLRGGQEAPQDRPCFAQATDARFLKEPLEMVVWQGHKLIRAIQTGRSALYDLANDPLERQDVAEGRPDLVDLLREQLDTWRDSVQASVALDAAERGAAEAGQEVYERLRNMGYLD